MLQPLLQGKSINTPAFLLAALLEEGLVKPSEKKRCYECIAPSGFMDKLKPWIDSKTSLNVDEKPKKSAPSDSRAIAVSETSATKKQRAKTEQG